MAVELTARAEITRDSLTVRYEVTTSKPIYLVNQVTRWTEDGFGSAPGVVYAEVLDGTLRLTKACLEVPDHLDVESPDVPWLTPVESSYAEAFDVTLPVEGFNPYLIVDDTAVVEYERVSLVVGWIPGEIEVRRGTRSDGVEVISADYATIIREQRLLTASLNVPPGRVTYEL